MRSTGWPAALARTTQAPVLYAGADEGGEVARHLVMTDNLIVGPGAQDFHQEPDCEKIFDAHIVGRIDCGDLDRFRHRPD